MGDAYATGGHQMSGYADPGWIKTGGRCEGGLRAVGGRSGLKPKDLVGMPWRLAFALQAAGWWLRADIIWAKPNPMPESVTDRPTKAHEYLFLLTKSARYFYDGDAIREPQDDPACINHGGGLRHDSSGAARRGASELPNSSLYNPLGRNARSVWSIATSPFPQAHFATFPPEIPRRCILAGTSEGDLVLDPFAGAGTTLLVADRLGREAIGIELNPEYAAMAQRRIESDSPLFAEVKQG
jgi:DNA modification methylase